MRTFPILLPVISLILAVSAETPSDSVKPGPCSRIERSEMAFHVTDTASI
jgi:hypothetical protein